MKFYPQKELNGKNLLKGGKVKLVHSDSMTFAEWTFDAGADLPEHSHPHEQITKVIRGEFELTVNGRKVLLKDGDAIVIAPNEIHSGKSITDSMVVDVFHPVREDLR
jgi:quercetin dioxygenase-like cupin family protein